MKMGRSTECIFEPWEVAKLLPREMGRCSPLELSSRSCDRCRGGQAWNGFGIGAKIRAQEEKNSRILRPSGENCTIVKSFLLSMASFPH